MNVVMFVTGNSDIDPRVQYEKQTLEDEGNSLYIFDWKDKPKNKIKWFIMLISWYYHIYRQVIMIDDIDIIHCHDFDTLFLGVLLKRKLHCKLIYDSHEMYAYMTNIWLVIPFERLLTSTVDRVITVDGGTENYQEYVSKKIPVVIGNKKISVVPFYQKPENKMLTVLYLGTLTKMRMFPELVDIFGMKKDVCFIVGGYGTEYDRVEQYCNRYDNVIFLGMVEPNKILEYTLQADLIVCMLNPSNKNCRYGMPNKFYECLVCGRPMLVTQDTVLGDIIEKNNLGFVTSYSSDGIWVVLQRILEHPELVEQYGRNMFEMGKKMNWNIEKQKLVELYEDM